VQAPCAYRDQFVEPILSLLGIQTWNDKHFTFHSSGFGETR
jgi:hypothetical protein